MQILFIDSVDSTNNWVALHEQELASPCLVRAGSQIRGRGQRGNSWESEQGKNFTGSLLFHPKDFPASHQFLISEAISMAVVDTLVAYDIEAKVKWPNDIYVGNRKICGILTEHVILGKNISRTISGVGINVNQEIFLSDAPNPVSMKNILGKDFDLDEFSEILTKNIESRIKLLESPEVLHAAFIGTLWRGDGEFHDFHDRKRNENIKAAIDNISTDGFLTLALDNGERRRYAFKEVEFLL